MQHNDKYKIKINNKTLIVNESHLHQHPEINDIILDIFKNFLEQEKNHPEKIIKLEINMGKIIGKTICVLTNESSDIFYAQRKGRNTFTRFVKNIEPQDCDTVTIIASRGSENTFHLVTAYIGFSSFKEPLDSSIKSELEFLEAKNFWHNHALVENSQSFYKNTITTVCPWDNFKNRPKINHGNKNNILDIVNQMRKENSIIITHDKNLKKIK